MTWEIEGKRVIITGGNSGIGKATAAELARRGAKVMITSRDAARGRDALEDIRLASGIEIQLGQLDLSRLDSVRAFAATYLSDVGGVDILINNAGVMAGKRRTTPDGFEWTFGVNHLGPFLLTNLLSDALVANAQSRVISVSSETHRSMKRGLDFDDLQMESGYSSSKAYAASKLANILFSVELERRLSGSGVTAVSLHPGVVATSFGKGSEGPTWMKASMTLLAPLLKKPESGAQTSVFVASAPVGEVSGQPYWSDSAPRDPSPAALDSDAAERLWSISERLVGIEGA